MPAVWVPLAILGGWLVVLPSSVVTLSLRLKEIHPVGWETPYSVILGIGWLMMIVSLVVGGRLSDAAARRGGGRGSGRRALLLVTVPVIAAVSTLLAFSYSPWLVGLAWVLLQIPVGLALASALGWGGASVTESRRGLLSGLVGAAPLVSLVAGAAIARLAPSPTLAFLVVGLLGAALFLPLALRGDESASAAGAVAPSGSGRRVGAVLAGAWIAFLAADLLMSASTSTTNGFLVAFVDEVLRSSSVKDLATLSLLIASGLGLFASVVSGWLSSSLRRAASMFAIGCSFEVAGVALLLLLQTDTSLLWGAVLVGMGFGLANGAEFALVLAIRGSSSHVGADMGLLTAITAVPYVLVPLLAAAVFGLGASVALIALFVGAAACALLAVVLSVWVASRSRSVA